MKTCDSCKWWNKGICYITGTIIAEKPDTLIDIEVKVLDDTGLYYDLKTGPKFGCVLHTDK